MVPSVEVKIFRGNMRSGYQIFCSKLKKIGSKKLSIPEISKHDFIFPGVKLFNRIRGPKAVKNGNFITAFTRLRFFVAGRCLGYALIKAP